MLYSLTVFQNIFDNSTQKRMDFTTWEKFESLMYQLSELRGYKPRRGETPKMEPSPLISPAIYKRDTTRANSNVVAWGAWAALDVDEYTGSVEDVLRPLADYYYVCYSTASSTLEHPKFRIVLPLTTTVEAEQIRHFWYALNKEFLGVADAQTKDLSRMYYVPAQYDAHNFIFTHPGKHLEYNTLLEKHEYVEQNSGTLLDKLPAPMREAILAHRRAQLSNTSIRWTGYDDCPFCHKKLIQEYKTIAHVDGSGRYRMIYKIMTSIACRAVQLGYPISASEIAMLIRELDADTAAIYQRRHLEVEAERAILYAMSNRH